MKKVGLTYIIDDDYIFRIIATKMLEAHPSYEQTEEFRGGESALEALNERIAQRKKLPDLILLDIDMPLMDAWQFLEKFRQLHLPQKVTVVAVSSSINPRDIQRAHQHSDVLTFVPKPLSEARLTELAESL